MCGLTGILTLGGRGRVETGALLDRMTDVLAHRGPDDRGTWSDGRIALGSRRLAVIDLSPNGHMPMQNEDGSVVIVYNGEVYNFRELKERHRLEERGHVFRSRTDTEVLLHLYEELGAEMARELNGMFAIAIWDARGGPGRGVLHLIRDRYGIKPLFYQRDAEHFRFASEIKSILADPRVPRRPSLQALHDFLSFDYVPGVQTAFEGIAELAPGQRMSVESDGSSTCTRYWDLAFEPDHGITEAVAVERARELLERALERRLIADVPIGVLLSGGLDSSTLVALMARRAAGPLHTYSVGFEDPSFDEASYAASVARAFGTQHREVLVTAERVRALLPKYLTYVDEPYGDGSAIPTYLVCELAKGEVVVVLSGEGGDEVFGGYDTYAAFRAAARARRVPRWLRDKLVSPLVQRLPVSDKKLSLDFKLKRFLGGIDLSVPEAHLWWRIVLSEDKKWALYADGVRERFTPLASARHFTEPYERQTTPEELSRLMYLDATVFMPDDLMIKNDRMSMAHSLEARVPFTDPELTTYMASVPAALKLKGGRKKHLLIEAMRRDLPEAILKRKKIGLEMPYSRWFKRELADLLLDYTSPERVGATGLFRPAAVGELVREHLENKVDHGRALWGFVNYMMWHELYIA